MTDLDPRLTDEDAQKVLARALELQTQGAGALSMAQIREIASELSIPPSAVDQALSEYQAAATAEGSARAAGAVEPTSRSRNRSARMVLLSLAVVGGAFVLLMILTMIMRF